MNYSDFDKIEQDEWSLARPIFLSTTGGTLTVVGFCWHNFPRCRRVKKYIVECDVCKKDNPLHGDGLYKIFKKDLCNGRIPCGCSKKPIFTRDQWEVRIKRAAEEKGFKFISFSGEFDGGRTKLEISCPEHGSWYSTTAESLISNSPGCPVCGRTRTIDASRREYSYHVEKFMETGKFHKDTEFWRSGKKSGAHYWFYKCPVCSEDEYTKAGLCKGVFEACGNSLKKGILPCRCSKSARLTGPQWEYEIKKRDGGRGYTFIRWINKPGRFCKFEYRCPIHGLQEMSVNNYLQGQGCPECVGQDQRQCYINQVLDQGSAIAIKFGVTRNSRSRIERQNARNLFQMARIGVWRFPSAKSCKDAEKQCKKELECRILTKRELEDGYTETTYIKNLDRVIEIYENHGGKRISAKEER